MHAGNCVDMSHDASYLCQCGLTGYKGENCMEEIPVRGVPGRISALSVFL
jgi:hypothetical protein